MVVLGWGQVKSSSLTLLALNMSEERLNEKLFISTHLHAITFRSDVQKFNIVLPQIKKKKK